MITVRNSVRATALQFAIFAPILALASPARAATAARSVSVVQRGYEGFRHGTFGDAGANTYLSAQGRIETIHRWDLNHDGELDLLFTQDHNHDYAPDSMIYWGNLDGPESIEMDVPELRTPYTLLKHSEQALKRVTWLPSLGGGRCVIADLNGDGYPDIIFGNFMHNYRQDMPAYIYWGGAQGYNENNRTVLPGYVVTGIAVADLNGDGLPDIVVANQGFEKAFESRFGPMSHGKESYIYWGHPNGYSVARRTSIPTDCAEDVAVGDFNGDGHLDLAFVNNSDRRNIYVYWGDGSGNFSASRRQVLEFADPASVSPAREIIMKTLLAADLNKDGYTDLVVGGNHNVIIFHGSARGLNPQRTADFPADNCLALEAADLKKTGHLDLIVANAGEGAKSPPSTIYWGSDHGYSAEQRTDLPTAGASTVKAGDLNHDGYIDLLFGNANADHPVPSQIFWGGPEGFSITRERDLQSFNALGAGIADLNHDGNLDVVLINHLSGSDDLPAEIYWGNKDHSYSSATMTPLKPGGIMMYAVADFDDDGYPDIAMTYRKHPVIWWGSASGYSTKNRTVLPIPPPAAGSNNFSFGVADLNGDGHLDLVCTLGGDGKTKTPPQLVILYGNDQRFVGARTEDYVLPGNPWSSGSLSIAIADLNRDGYLDLVLPMVDIRHSEIWWGGPRGFDPKRATILDTNGPVSATLADLDRDGWLDIIFTSGIMGNRKPGEPVIGGSGVLGTTRNSEIFIYWGGPDGFKTRTAVQSFGALGATVADFNRDGHLDFAISNYLSDETRELPAMIYWGDGTRNFSNQRRSLLPAASPSAILALDLNRDGWPDLIISNHQKEFSHNSGTNIYWGGRKGFSISNRTTIPTVGVHMTGMVDPGNIYDRRYQWDYVSSPIAAPEDAQFARLKWKAVTELGTGVKFQVRFASASAQLSSAKWMGPTGEGSFYLQSDAPLAGVPEGARWLQYRAVLTSPDGGNTPYLDEVELVCAKP